MRHRSHGELGQTSAEYAAVMVLAVTIILALAALNGAIFDLFDRVVAAILDAL